jgi:phospholipid transport system substrate-binding protein
MKRLHTLTLSAVLMAGLVFSQGASFALAETTAPQKSNVAPLDISITETSPEAYVRKLTQLIITDIISSDRPHAAKFADVSRIVHTYVDTPRISKFVLSRYWRAATPEERGNFVEAFEKFIILTLWKQFDSYNGQEMVVLGAIEKNRYVEVASQVIEKNAKPIDVIWRVAPNGDKSFTVIDLVPESASLAVKYRDEYTSYIKRNGRKVAPLIDSLHAKNAELAQNVLDASRD